MSESRGMTGKIQTLLYDVDNLLRDIYTEFGMDIDQGMDDRVKKIRNEIAEVLGF